jgi:hypothetical protein
MRYVTTLAALALWLLGASPSAFAQMQGEIQAPQKGFDVRPAAASPSEQPKDLVLAIDGDRVRGEKGAGLVLVDFTDYQ